NNIQITKGIGGLTVDSVALGGQIRAISKSRLLRQRGTLSNEIMQSINRALEITLDL
ncbi:MAG: type II toxin-antitoxin system PemK/MazF family toxin, partial [Chloroflexi bacterium]|nr:type II toxin-antitoxin system PemK/MazF family toxin [Chloroflexota bacterium]